MVCIWPACLFACVRVRVPPQKVMEERNEYEEYADDWRG